MSIKTEFEVEHVVSHSILAFSHNATTAYRFFTKEDFLHMMSDMSMEDILQDLKRFREMEEYRICKKIMYVIEQKKAAENLLFHTLIDA